MQTGDPEPPGVGHFFIALSPEAFAPEGEFGERFEAFVAQMHGAAPSPGVERILVPGELEIERAEQAASGLEVPAGVLEAMLGAAERVGVSPPGDLEVA